jgi:anti-sigma factor RsiW
MNHRDAWARLDEFLDGALAAEARWAVVAHLEDCAICRRHVATKARLRGMVREHLTALEPPPGLNARLAAALAAEAATPHPQAVAPRARSPLPMGLVALLGPAVAALWLLAALATPATRLSADLTSELAATHALFAQDESLLDVVGDAAIVTAWFRDEVGLQVSAPELENYTLVGGRLITLDGRAVAQLVYEGTPDEVYLSLLRFKHQGTDRGPMALSDGFALGQQGTMALVTWVAGEDRVALIAAAPTSELRRLAGELATRADGDESPPF